MNPYVNVNGSFLERQSGIVISRLMLFTDRMVGDLLVGLRLEIFRTRTFNVEQIFWLDVVLQTSS